MHTYSLLAPAKINLYLEILGYREDGYHELAMVMQSIGLADRLTLRPLPTQTIRLLCHHPELTDTANNLAYRAAQLMATEFQDMFSKYGGVEITLDKRIPIGAGLAGGSTDAAAVLVGIDLLWRLGLTREELQHLGARLGSDVPFCIAGGTSLATGRGEVLSPLTDLADLWIVLAKYRSLHIDTGWAYRTYRQQFGQPYVPQPARPAGERVRSGALVSAIAHRDHRQLGLNLSNDFERVIFPAHPQVQQLREVLQVQPGVLGAMMSGSGPSVFALVESQAEAIAVQTQVREQLADPDLDLWVTQVIPTGIQIITDG
ncbi:4-(cytidine 5'-diphospho)-2-C-methyl-D-erythritol kinase [Trichothermofontia sichuanensis B231]|uniref:4-(cytidine 5'-diphospho)-2-C-methyl-D-erythritol kinase n=1 Tax=Trichothermofontia sichuanensis TaxID=3045816 RepID=UPI00224786F6|nr:4-(cytidine 5'-diphospho)-2-C-methyl-D-erythritol kinase [Trichothermofontia sichuanensis]UZQ54808.1 4-(cytidine 5'-diphospho)-2-C-methyl-D-erythritol kinase [Trichothermofontia sichuanensis B231]